MAHYRSKITGVITTANKAGWAQAIADFIDLVGPITIAIGYESDPNNQDPVVIQDYLDFFRDRISSGSEVELNVLDPNA